MWKLWGSGKEKGEGTEGDAASGSDPSAQEDAALIELKKLIWDLLADGETDATGAASGTLTSGGREEADGKQDAAKRKPDETEDEPKVKEDGDSASALGEQAGTTDPSLGSWMGGSRHDGRELERPSDSTMRRFLRGHKQDPKIAAERVRKYVDWRASTSYGLDHPVREISSATPGIQEQVATGKCYILNQKDKMGRPIIVVHVRRHDPAAQSKDDLTRFGVYILETAERRLAPNPDPEKEKFCIIFDLEAISISNIDYHAAKRIIYMLTYFYPERMGVTLLLSAPMIFSAAWPVIRPWLHPNSQAKIQFVKPADLTSWIDPPALPKIWGGEDATEYVQPGETPSA